MGFSQSHFSEIVKMGKKQKCNTGTRDEKELL